MFDSLPGWGGALLTFGLVAAIILESTYLIQPIFRFIHITGLCEIYTALALLIVMGISFLMTLIELSPALGTFLAGAVLAKSEVRHELESDIEPFKGLLLELFFITVSADMNVALLLRNPTSIVILALGVIAVKALIL